jgi:hypothetical protein
LIRAVLTPPLGVEYGPGFAFRFRAALARRPLAGWFRVICPVPRFKMYFMSRSPLVLRAGSSGFVK